LGVKRVSASPMRRSVCQRQNYSVCILERFLFSSGPSHNPPGSHPHSWWTCGPVHIGVPRGFECCFLCGGLIDWTQAQTAVTQTRRVAMPAIGARTFPRTITRRRPTAPGCATARTLLRSPTADAAAPPVSWPPPPPPASSRFYRRARTTLVPIAADPYPVRTDR